MYAYTHIQYNFVTQIYANQPDFYSPLSFSFRLTHKSIDRIINSQNKPITTYVTLSHLRSKGSAVLQISHSPLHRAL